MIDANSSNQFKNLLDRHFIDVMYDLDVQAYCLYPKSKRTVVCLVAQEASAPLVSCDHTFSVQPLIISGVLKGSGLVHDLKDNSSHQWLVSVN